jgi:hypothetical protein
MRFAILLPAAALIAASPVLAQEVPPEIVQLKAYVNTPDYIATTATIALTGDRDLAPDCKAAKTEQRVGFVVMKKPEWKAETPHPVAGQWKDQIKIDRCGTPIVHNVLVTAVPGKVPQVGLALPGETALSPRLQGKAIADVLKEGAARLKCKKANKAVVTDTKLDKVIEQPRANQKGVVIAGKWQETWTVRACDKTGPVTLEMAADGKGGAGHKILK